MAIDQTISQEDERGMAQPSNKGGMLKIVLILLAMLLLAGASAGAALMFSGALDGMSGGAKTHAVEDKADKRPGAKAAAPIYVELGEPFVVNFIQGSQIRYLQVKIEVMTRNPEIPAAIETHLPKIRNNLVFMFSGFDYQSLGTVAGKQKIRDEALAEIQSILSDEIGDSGVESVYFTSFVMQ